MVDVAKRVADDGFTGTPLTLVLGDEHRAGYPKVTHQDAVKVLHELTCVGDLTSGETLVDPPERTHVVDELSLGLRRRLKLALDCTFCLDDRQFIALDQRRVVDRSNQSLPAQFIFLCWQDARFFDDGTRSSNPNQAVHHLGGIAVEARVVGHDAFESLSVAYQVLVN